MTGSVLVVALFIGFMGITGSANAATVAGTSSRTLAEYSYILCDGYELDIAPNCPYLDADGNIRTFEESGCQDTTAGAETKTWVCSWSGVSDPKLPPGLLRIMGTFVTKSTVLANMRITVSQPSHLVLAEVTACSTWSALNYGELCSTKRAAHYI